MDSLRYFIHELKPDVMVITETWLKMVDQIEISGYNSIRKDRENKAGGGIIIFTKKNTVQEVIVKQPNEKDNNEILWINGKIGGKAINLCASYQGAFILVSMVVSDHMDFKVKPMQRN